MELADCPVFPAEAGNALSTDRGLGWRLAREAGPVLRHPEANWMFANWVLLKRLTWLNTLKASARS